MARTPPDPEALDQAIAAMSKAESGRWKRRLIGAWLLGHLPIPEGRRADVEKALTAALKNRAYAFNGCTGILAVLCTFGNLIGAPWLIWMLIHDGRVNAVRTEAAEAIGRIGCIAALPELVAAATNAGRPGSSKLRSATLSALKQLLRQIAGNPSGDHPSEIETSIARLLSGKDPDMPMLALDALERIGGAGCHPAVLRLARRPDSDPLQHRAAQILPIIVERAARARASSRLLRPAERPAEDVSLLLRPGTSPPDQSTELLLRPSESDEAENAS